MISFIIIVCIIFAGSGFGPLTVKAADWEKPVYAYGDALTDEQMETMAQNLGYELNDLELLIIHVSDMGKYIDVHATGNMASSAILVKQKKGAGVEVEIKHPELITEVTKGEYENAMITAGVTDMLILVDSPVEATGHSALTGIYKAYETEEETLDAERMRLAQDELVITSGIVQEHQSNEAFDAHRFNNSMRGVKLNLGKEKKDKVDEKVVDRIVTDAIEEEDLEKVLTEFNVEDILELFMRYSQTSAMDDEDVKEQLEIGFDGEIDEGFFKKIMNFISGLFASIFGSDAVDEEVNVEVEPEPEDEVEEVVEELETEVEEPEPEEVFTEAESIVEGEEASNMQDNSDACQDDYEEVLKDLPSNFFIPECAKITGLNKDSNELSINFEVEGDWLEVLEGYKQFFDGKVEEEIQDRKAEYGEITAFYYKEEAAYTKVVVAQDDAIVFIDVFQVLP